MDWFEASYLDKKELERLNRERKKEAAWGYKPDSGKKEFTEDDFNAAYTDLGLTPPLPPATTWKGIRKGASELVLSNMADAEFLDSEQLKEIRDTASPESIVRSDNLTDAQKAALIYDEQGDSGALDDLLEMRAGRERLLRDAAKYVHPGEYAPRETALGRFYQSVVEN
jgi:hypothetical protein